jgi:DNA topoisomerase-3
MENAGLGTPHTRTRAVDGLFACGYIEQRGKNIVPTEKGRVVNNFVKNTRIAAPELSSGWGRALSDVARGKQDAATFMTAFQIFTRQVTEEILSLNPACKKGKVNQLLRSLCKKSARQKHFRRVSVKLQRL